MQMSLKLKKTKQKKEPDKENVKFEDAMIELENIVERLQDEELGLEDSLSVFERGINLVKYCSSKLDDTKKKVEILTKKNGKIIKKDFDEYK